MFDKVLIANRGEIACRVIRTLDRMGIASVAVHSEADAEALHVRLATEAVCVGPAPAAQSYLAAERILEAARRTGAQAIHPGYGFLSENAEFAEGCAAAGMVFVGPRPHHLRAFGLKHTAKELAAANDVPLLPGSGLLRDAGHAQAEAARIGYPVMLKSTGGGGGIGMRLCWSADELAEAFGAVQRLASANFKDAGLFLERYVEHARHIEVQVFGDGRGGVIALGERDCSVQRRNQKVIEETPAPGLTDRQRTRLHATAVRLVQAVEYESAGTVEFVCDAQTGEFHFLEVNTRLQVEHGVTEQVTGVDLVEWMLRQAAGEFSLEDVRVAPRGASIQVRLYAEDPARSFQPSPGLLTEVEFPAALRVDTWVERGTVVPPHYDPMLAKLIGTGATRAAALDALVAGLEATRLGGIVTNREYLLQVLRGEVFREARQTTRYLNSLHFHPLAVEVVEPGVQTSVQDFPGRLGYWQVGVPPSGPMDALSFRIANRLAGNDEDAAGLELTVCGPTLRFHCNTTIALAGAEMRATLDERPLANHTAHAVEAGQVLGFGGLAGAGLRAYLAIAGGFDVPRYLGSRSTFTLGQFGGHAGRSLRTGDMLPVRAMATTATAPAIARKAIPVLTHAWTVDVMYGPHGAPDFFTDDDIATFFATEWEVHYNSSRTGVRLIGPKPRWSRPDGGEAGLHPSNIHDNAYAIGAIDFTGDMPVILGPDGPSLGGFVCPAVVVQADLWKLGQLKPGDTVRFRRVSRAAAAVAQAAAERLVATLAAAPASAADAVRDDGPEPAMLDRRPASGDRVEVIYRQAGDDYLLVEYGPLQLDWSLRLRVHALQSWLEARRLRGVVDLTPGVRSLQVHFDNRVLPVARLLEMLRAAEEAWTGLEACEVPSRIVHLPLAWNDSQTRLAIARYAQSVRRDAPWCPSNLEFIRRINGLETLDDVRRIVFDASYMVLGLGDVYLGAPVATPVDPRHRLVTTKYNPARTWTPENAVGIGGAYLCVYGMEGPGGYQFVGRTVQMWNRWRVTPEFPEGRPWLLRFFDQIRFHEVSEDELLQIRRDFPLGRYRLRIEPTTFRLHDYRRFLEQHAAPIAAFKQRQQAAFEAERERWQRSGQTTFATDSTVAEAAVDAELDLPPRGRAVGAQVAGNLWKLEVAAGTRVERGATLAIVESMKTEIAVTAPCAGTVHRVFCSEGMPVSAGQDLLVLVEDR